MPETFCDQIEIAALLHDVVEDSENGEAVAKLIKREFGKKVRNIVLMCSDTTIHPKPPWLERKRNYLAHVRSEAHAGEHTGFLRVTSADKLYNVRSTIDDLREHGEWVWQRFTTGREGALWYYRTIATKFDKLEGTPLVEQLCRAVAELERLAASADADAQ